jgi:hypothetical protein
MICLKNLLIGLFAILIFISCSGRQGSQGQVGPAGPSPTPAIKNYDLSMEIMFNSLNYNDAIIGNLSYTDAIGLHSSNIFNTDYCNVTATGKSGDVISITVDATITTCTSCTTSLDVFGGQFFYLNAYDPVSGLTCSWFKSFVDNVPANTKTIHITMTKQLP